MAIHELNEEQIQTWTLEQKDRWWLENVYRGDMPQLTIRSALTGMVLGGVLSLTNLYVGAKTGWTLGVGITSVILAYALFKVMSKAGLAQEFTVLENNAMQSIATAAGYMTSPMISSLAAYMMVTGTVIPMWHTFFWITCLAILGVLFAFPFKRRFINDEQQPFPEGRAAGIVMDSLHHGEARASMLKAKLLVIFALLAAGVKLLQSEGIFNWLRSKLVTFVESGEGDLVAASPWQSLLNKILHPIPEFPDGWLYRLFERLGYAEPNILGTSLKTLTIRPELDLAMLGAGGLMGIRTGTSLLIGALINYVMLAPIMIERGDIETPVTFRTITMWSLWCGVSMMTVASLIAFFAKPQVLLSSFTNLFKPSNGSSNILKDIELPLSVSIVGIPLLGVAVVYMARAFFDVKPWVSVVALCLVFVFCMIAINSTGLTSITPIGAMGKITQLTFGIIAPGDKGTNLMTAGITGEVASHSANLLSDIKPGYMLGAKPRQQAVGHVLGVFAGAVLSVPVFYLVFLQLDPSEAFSSTGTAKYRLDETKYSMPSATTWYGVAEALTLGIDKIKEKVPLSARYAALIGALAGAAFEILRLASRNRFPLSPVGIGLGFIIHFHTCLLMFLGSFLFWVCEKVFADKDSRMNQVVVQNQEPICAGLIAGGSLMGIVVAVLEVIVLPRLAG